MKFFRRAALVTVLVLAVVLSPVLGVGTSVAVAQTPAPVPTPSPTVPVAPEPVASPSPPPAPPAPAPPHQGGGGGADHPVSLGPGSSAGGSGGAHSRGSHRRPSAPATDPYATTIWWSSRPSYSGMYSTSRLVALATRMKGMGPKTYAPFIIAGRASFSDTWGGIRRSSDTGLRPHLGQDVFCDYGAPVLAAEHGWIDHGSDSSGGLVARLHRADGSYWYYAHLSGFNPSVPSGQNVSPGDVIGYCGTSGNAIGSPPHVHFGLYSGGVALNPMGALIGWLDAAERKAARIVATQDGRDVRRGHRRDVSRVGGRPPAKRTPCPRLPVPPPPPDPVVSLLLPGSGPQISIPVGAAGVAAAGPTHGRRVAGRDPEADPARYLGALSPKDASIEIEVVSEVIPIEGSSGVPVILEETLALR